LEKDKHIWEDLADLDPLWAVSSFSEYRFRKWDTGQFFKTGDEEISKLMQACLQMGYPKGTECVLDFGCGVWEDVQERWQNILNNATELMSPKI
jgi:hypothetical protein